MSLTDRAKEVTGKAVLEAKKGAAKVQEKVENVQLRQKANGLAKEIGYLVVKEKGGESVPAGEIDRLAAEIRSIEDQIKADRASTETDATAPAATPDQ
jgi:seryl-tRNA synthetase